MQCNNLQCLQVHDTRVLRSKRQKINILKNQVNRFLYDTYNSISVYVEQEIIICILM